MWRLRLLLGVCCLWLAPASVWAGSQIELPEATPVRLRLPSQVLFSTAKVGDTVSFAVAEDVSVEGHLVIARGTPVRATVATIFQVGSRPRLSMNISRVQLVTGQWVNLDTHPGENYKILNFYTVPEEDLIVPTGTEATVYTEAPVTVAVLGPVVAAASPPPQSVAESPRQKARAHRQPAQPEPPPLTVVTPADSQAATPAAPPANPPQPIQVVPEANPPGYWLRLGLVVAVVAILLAGLIYSVASVGGGWLHRDSNEK